MQRHAVCQAQHLPKAFLVQVVPPRTRGGAQIAFPHELELDGGVAGGAAERGGVAAERGRGAVLLPLDRRVLIDVQQHRAEGRHLQLWVALLQLGEMILHLLQKGDLHGKASG